MLAPRRAGRRLARRGVQRQKETSVLEEGQQYPPCRSVCVVARHDAVGPLRGPLVGEWRDPTSPTSSTCTTWGFIQFDPLLGSCRSSTCFPRLCLLRVWVDSDCGGDGPGDSVCVTVMAQVETERVSVMDLVSLVEDQGDPRRGSNNASPTSRWSKTCASWGTAPKRDFGPRRGPTIPSLSLGVRRCAP